MDYAYLQAPELAINMARTLVDGRPVEKTARLTT
jgi:hypothetical protein